MNLIGIGRYTFKEDFGKGGFGVVKLSSYNYRYVAIKVCFIILTAWDQLSKGKHLRILWYDSFSIHADYVKL